MPKFWNFVLLYGYKRHLPGNLTMVTLGYRCMSRGNAPSSTFALSASEKDGGVRLRYQIPERFHEFRLPDEFEQRIEERLVDKAKGDEVQYKKLLGIK